MELNQRLTDEVKNLRKNRMRLAIGLALVIAVAVAVAVAVVCGITIPRGSDSRPSTSPFAGLRTSAPTYTLTLSPTQAPTQFMCFDSRLALLNAVDEYLANNGPDTNVSSSYGWPIGSWCVSRITDFSSVFSTDRNPDASTFDESLTNWDMSQGRMFRAMVSL
jgi:amino acid transporter